MINDEKNKSSSTLKLFHDYFKSKKNKSIKNKNIYFKYLNNNNIIFQDKGDINNENLKLLLKELNKDMECCNNLLLPFLNVGPNLVKAYIESDLDNINIGKKEKNSDLNEPIYIKTFVKLKTNCFINRETLYPIYNNFSKLFDLVTGAREIKKKDDYLFKRLKKLIKLFEVFYDKNIYNKNPSSFCFLGGNMTIIFNQELLLSKINQIVITINILDNDYIDYLKNDLSSIKINEENIEISELNLSKSNNEQIKTIKISIIKNED